MKERNRIFEEECAQKCDEFEATDPTILELKEFHKQERKDKKANKKQSKAQYKTCIGES